MISVTLSEKLAWGSFLFPKDVARAYRQLPLDPRDWPLVCFTVEDRFYMDIIVPFGLRWSASHCQDATNLVSRELRRWGISLLNYIDDFGGVTSSQFEAESHFFQLQGLLETLGLQEACHKASPLPRSWCGWGFSLTP